MKRKLLALLLALGLCAAMAAPVLAVEPEEENEPPAVTTTTEDPAAEGEEAPAEGEEPVPEVPPMDMDAEMLEAANKLFELGLFRGVGTSEDGTPDFALDRAATRAEAVTMLVRLLGQENAALAGTWETPFTDVADWALPYVGYAYANGLTMGTGATTFGSNDPVSTTQYLTFVLRALGYESGTDFAWDSAWTLTDELGIMEGYYSAQSGFVRGDAAMVSVAALDISVKGGDKTLLTVIQENLAASEAPAEETPAEETPAEETPAEGEEAPAEGEEAPAEGAEGGEG